MKQALVKFFRDEEGATAIEYGLIAGLIAAALLVTLGLIGDELVRIFQLITTKLSTVT